MGRVTHALGIARASLLSFAFFLVVPIADACIFVGSGSFYFIGSSVGLKVDEVRNTDNGNSGLVRLELWAYSAPGTPGPFQSYKLAEYNVGQIQAFQSAKNIDTGPLAYVNPPSGSWQFVILMMEHFSAAAPDERQGELDLTPIVIAPQPGLWWNKDEPGRGYTLDYRHGTLIITTYAYQQGGAPQWYLSSGALNGSAFTATLDKYSGGQCITCTFSGSGALVGNDGPISINFTSSTTASATLPGGRVIQIELFEF